MDLNWAVPKELRIHLTLSEANLLDVELMDHLRCFSTGTGKSERSTEIKRLLRKGIFEEKSALAFGHMGYAGRTIRPTLFSEDAVEKRPVFNLEMPQPKSEPDNAAPAPGEAADAHAQPQAAQIQMDSAIEGVPSTKDLPISPVAKASNNPAAMLGYLMDALAAEEEQKPI